MSAQDNNTPRCIEVTDDEDESWVINSITNATAEPASTARIHRVPTMVKDKEGHEKYYIPNVISIGPYHHGNPKFELVKKLIPIFTTKLVSNEETLWVLYRKLDTMVQDLRNFYEENSTNEFCNKNQIPFVVLDEVMKVIDVDFKIEAFICDNILASKRPKEAGLTLNQCFSNLIAYEMCSRDASYDAWVTSYICFMDTLIDHPEDVTALRKAGVVENCLGCDEEVAKLFNEIGTDLVPNNLAYLEAKNSIQMHYENPRNKYFSQLKQEDFKSPWSLLAFLGALSVIILNGVQTYFTIWPKSECDDLCMMLKKNHHI
ncbi:hypothetical protein L1987_04344 [Smallanthus sonchifolius]|uniref:Uncharacterized protein n=1 Tax=Smallanthus sonchifolius TaxID=185202 RepID=A0ACB9KDG5_9ASTR|nr:hypothetical protein L1987_04344 [Smallanthus sonchifolius]